MVKNLLKKTSERFSRSELGLYIFFFHLLSDLKPFADSKLVDIVISILKLLVSQVRIFERRIQNASYDLNENCFCKNKKVSHLCDISCNFQPRY